MTAILRREFSAYFKSPIGYIYLAIIYFFGGEFLLTLLYSQINTIASIYSNMFSILLFTTPILTMRLMSEDKRLKTDQALLTAPVSLHGIVWGKFLASFIIYSTAMGITIFYFFILSALSTPEWSIFLGNLFGILILGAALLSIGLFISSLTESQMVAAIGGFAAMFFVFMIDTIGSLIPIAAIQTIFASLSFSTKYADFTSGILDFSNVLFFISVAVVFNFLTVRVLEKKRWS